MRSKRERSTAGRPLQPRFPQILSPASVSPVFFRSGLLIHSGIRTEMLWEMRTHSVVNMLRIFCAIYCGKPAESLRMTCGDDVQKPVEILRRSGGEAVEFTSRTTSR